MSDSRYIEAIREIGALSSPSVFLAGGITGCDDWQKTMARLLLERTTNLVVFNPRRANFPIGDPSAAEAQIKWEHRHLRAATAISFWFTNTSIQPIVLYELGAWSMTTKRIFVGIEPGYVREQDVRIQTRLTRPEVQIVSKLTDLAQQVAEWVAT